MGGKPRQSVALPFLDRILEKPLSAYPTTCKYACFHWSDFMGNYWASRKASEFSKVVQPAGGLQKVDLACSFLLDPWEWLEYSPMETAMLDRLEDEALLGRLLPGAVFARLIKTMPKVSHLSVISRAQTDHTLLGALCSALELHKPMQYLELDEDAQVEPEWASMLGEIADSALREHVSCFFLDAQSARCFGGRFTPKPCTVAMLANLKGFKLLAGWSYGEGQAGVGVFRVP